MIDKRKTSYIEALKDVSDGSSILIGGFGVAGEPKYLIEALINHGAASLTLISNNAGAGDEGIAKLIKCGRVSKIICSFPRSSNSHAFQRAYESKSIQLEVIPQGTLAERIRAAGAGIGGFYVRTSVGTVLGQGKEIREINGIEYVFEQPLSADFALVHAFKSDRWGNLQFNKTARNFGPIMAMAASVTIVEFEHFAKLGSISPENIMTPGIFVDRIVQIEEGSR